MIRKEAWPSTGQFPVSASAESSKNLKDPKGTKAPRILSRIHGWILVILCCDPKGSRTFMMTISTEGRGVGLCWAKLKPKGPQKEDKGFRAGPEIRAKRVHHFISDVYPKFCPDFNLGRIRCSVPARQRLGCWEYSIPQGLKKSKGGSRLMTWENSAEFPDSKSLHRS